MVHRDLKPSNVVLTEAGPIVIDFGIASAADETAFTRTGTALGSAGWMAPEQAEGHRAGPPADVFAWAATVVFAATGRAPFGSGPAQAVLYRVVHHQPDVDGIGEPLLHLLRSAMSKDPATRPTIDQIAACFGPDDLTIVGLVATTWIAPSVVTQVLDSTAVIAPPPQPVTQRGRKAFIAIAVVVTFAIAAVAAGWVAARDEPGMVRAVQSRATTTNAPASSAPPAVTAESTSASTVPPTTAAPPPTAAPVTVRVPPLFSATFGAATPDALALLNFATAHELETVTINATIFDLEREDLSALDGTASVLFVPGTCAQICDGDAYELLFRDLSAVPDASVFYDSGAWEIKGRFVVTGVQIQTGGIVSIALRAVPIG